MKKRFSILLSALCLFAVSSCGSSASRSTSAADNQVTSSITSSTSIPATARPGGEQELTPTTSETRVEPANTLTHEFCRGYVPDSSGACHSVADQQLEIPPIPPTTPLQPRNVIATAGDNRVSVAWDPPSSDGGSPITRYVVTASASPSSMCIWTAGPTQCFVTGLVNGIGYEFTVVAENAIGRGPESPITTQVTPVIDVRQRGLGAIEAGMTKLGAAYVWGAAGPDVFDNSGFVVWAYQQVGISLPHYSGAMKNSTLPITQSMLLPGDLVFWGLQGSGGVAIYIGSGQILHNPSSCFIQGVSISSLDWCSGNPPSAFGRLYS